MSEAPLKLVIVDDEAPARRRMRELLDDCAAALPLVVVGEAGSGREALGLLGSTPADLVLSDIHMPDMDGIELARHLLKLSVPPVLIFTTAYHEHAIAAFEVHAIDYLVKPVRVQRLLAALQKVPRLKPLSGTKLDRLPAAARRFLSVTERSRVVLVPIEEIVYLKAELKYITIRTAEREFLLEESLTKLEEEFGQRFVRVHRNCLVARDAIRGFERRVNADGDAHWEVLLRGVNEALPVSRRQQFIVREIGRRLSRRRVRAAPPRRARWSAVRSRSTPLWCSRTDFLGTYCLSRRMCCQWLFRSERCAASGAAPPATSPTT